MKRLIISLASVLLLSVAAHAQVSDYSQLRTNSWSLYGFGGAAIANGDGLFDNVNPSPDTYVAPMAGLGITWNVRPWIRFNLGTEASKFLREQRWSKQQADGLSYRSLDAFYDDIEFNAEFNLAQLFREKGTSGRFNVWLGSGIGEMFAFGTDYSISMGQKEVIDPNPKNDNYTFTAWLKAHNEGIQAQSPYIPANLSIEYDITPMFTLGLRGSAKYLLNGGNNMLPTWTESLGVVLRVNLLGARHGYRSPAKHVSDLEKELADALKENQMLKDGNQQSINELADKVNKLSDDLDKALDEIRNSKCDCCEDMKDNLFNHLTDAKEYVVYFANASAALDDKAMLTIYEAASTLKANPSATSVITASCSTPGGESYNKDLSDRRAQAVRQALIDAGVNASAITDIVSVGNEGMTADASCRRAIINIK